MAMLLPLVLLFACAGSTSEESGRYTSENVKNVPDCSGVEAPEGSVEPGGECDAERQCAPVCCDCIAGGEQVNSVQLNICRDGVCITEEEGCTSSTGGENSDYCE